MSEPATKEDLLALEQRLDGRMATKDDVSQAKEQMMAFMRGIETSLLRAFHSYAESNEVRLRKIEADVSNVNSAQTYRFAVMETRLLAVERKTHTLGDPEPGS